MAKLTVLGTGKMGEALVGGLLASGWREPAEITCTARGEDRLKELAERHGVDVTVDNAAAVRGADVIVIAVKPQDIEPLLTEVSPYISGDQTVLSVCAAIPTAFIERRLGENVPVVRAMPNTPSVVHEGMAGIAAGRHATEAHLETCREILTHVGRVVTVPESYLDAVTAISGSGPAYFALLAEAMIEAGILLGLSRETPPISSSRPCSGPPKCSGIRTCIRRAPGDGDFPRRDDDQGDQGSRAVGRPGCVPQRDTGSDGAVAGTRPG